MGQNFSEPVVDKETERAENETFKAAVSSCQGWRVSQEDNHSLMLELPQSEHKASFFAVYDGHGSARVSKHASEGLWRHLTANPNYKQGNFKEALEQAFLSFDKEVNESYTAQLAGTTAICVLIVDNVIYCANIGDSRAVASINCECEPLSQDHKPDNPEELKRIMAAGGYVLGSRVNGNLALSRAFGDFHYKSNENLAPEEQIVSPYPDIKRIELNEDVDFLVLACDGIWDVLTNEEVVKFVISRLEQNMEPGEICEQLTTRCLATDYELVIGCDNMTVLLVCHTRGRSWADYCTDIFNKNTKKLGTPRTRSFNPADLEDDTDVHRRRQQQLREQQQQQQQEEEERNAAAFLQGGCRSENLLYKQVPRDIRLLLDAIQNLHTDESSASGEGSSGGSASAGDSSNSNMESRITEMSADEDESKNSNDSPAKAEDGIAEDPELSESIVDTKKSTSNNADSSEIVSKTTEIHLSSPDDEEKSSADVETNTEAKQQTDDAPNGDDATVEDTQTEEPSGDTNEKEKEAIQDSVDNNEEQAESTGQGKSDGQVEE